MDLGERKSKILKAVIEDYISTAEPIGSRTIAKRGDLGISSATIRNEMSDLEEMGFLVQPHTSSGRIPSDLGYRFYVDEIMRQYIFNANQMEKIRREFNSKLLKLDTIVKEASNMLAQHNSNLITIATMPSFNKTTIKRFGLMYMDRNSMLVILVTSDSLVKNKLIYVSAVLDEEFVTSFSSVLNNRLSGMGLEQINLEYITQIKDYLGVNKHILDPILEFIGETITSASHTEVYYTGTTNILNQPEYSDIEKAKDLISFLENGNNLSAVVQNNNMGDKINISIGKENAIATLDDCSTIMINYNAGENATGKIGIIGPKRMDYAAAMQSIESIALHINNLFKQLYNSDRSEEFGKDNQEKRRYKARE